MVEFKIRTRNRIGKTVFCCTWRAACLPLSPFFVLVFTSTAPFHPEAPYSPVAAEGHLFLQATPRITDPPS